MTELTSEEFADFYCAIHGHHPYPWQTRLAKQVIDQGRWPQSINVPTGCGKTSCIDIAVYALACNPKLNPRRIVFVVNRRVVVDEGHERAKKISCCLDQAAGISVTGQCQHEHAKEPSCSLENKKKDILSKVRAKLCEISCSGIPLKSVVLRGGTHIDNEWSANPTQPTVISSTVDQAGSRLLFRGYGLGTMSKLVNAGLLGYDCIWILDETHISEPFTNTLRMVEKLRHPPWSEEAISRRPWSVVEMTATPISNVGERFEITKDDHNNPHIKKKLDASKICELIESKAKDSGDHEALASELVCSALDLSKNHDAKAVAVIANRVKTAKIAYDKLRAKGNKAYLMIGRMRPWDQDMLLNTLKPFRTGQEKPEELTFVVSTQCLEVGADFDFEAMVSEAASLDALRQRFGRLNRGGEYGNSRCAIVAPKSVLSKEGKDPIYEDAANKTWEFLKKESKNGVIDFGLAAFGEIIKKHDNLSDLLMSGSQYPTLLPSHMDLLCQTHNHLQIDPDISQFLHGFERGVPMVSVVWRIGWNDNNWKALMSSLPPRSIESMQVPLWDIVKYLKEDMPGLDEGDVEWQRRERNRDTSNSFIPKKARVWRGKRDVMDSDIKDVGDIRPNDVVVLPVEEGGWEELGHIQDMENMQDYNDKAIMDIAEHVYLKSTGKISIRVGNSSHVKTMSEDIKSLNEAIRNESSEDIEIIKERIWELLQNTDIWKSLESEARGYEKKDHNANTVFDYKVETIGKDGNTLLIHSWQRRHRKGKKNKSEKLKDHSEKVAENIKEYANKLDLDNKFAFLFEKTAMMHDAGKADRRFQQMLYRNKVISADEKLLAKDIGTKLENKKDYYPEGFRHEFVSSGLAKSMDVFDHDLFLHLIESHHGHCRPFVPVVIDDNGQVVKYKLDEVTLETPASTGIERVGSGAASRFWKCVRRYGWWGTAWLESLFILADWGASGDKK